MHGDENTCGDQRILNGYIVVLIVVPKLIYEQHCHSYSECS